MSDSTTSDPDLNAEWLEADGLGGYASGTVGGWRTRRYHAVLLTSLYDRQVAMYRAILEAGATQGVFTLAADSLAIARNLVALEDAYGYRIMAGHPTLDNQACATLILGYARLATNHPLPTEVT